MRYAWDFHVHKWDGNRLMRTPSPSKPDDNRDEAADGEAPLGVALDQAVNR